MTRLKEGLDLTSFHGIRTIFNISVVIYHTLLFVSLALDNPSDAVTLTTGSTSASIVSVIATLGVAAVDVFLLLSGFLLRASLQRVTPYKALHYVFFRYLRLAPVYVTISFALHLQGNPGCVDRSELLLLKFTNVNRCLIPGWSTSIDFLSHILLLPLLSSPSALASIILLAPPLRLWKWLQQGRPLHPNPVTPTDFFSSEEEINLFSQHNSIPRGKFILNDPLLIARREMLSAYMPLYFGVAHRIAPVVVGVLLYTSIHERNALYRTVQRFPTVSVLCMTAIWGFFHLGVHNLHMKPWGMLVYESAYGILPAMAISVVIILTCSISDNPSQHPVSRFLRMVLSCRVFQFLHRFSYTIYLLHGPVAFLLGSVPPKLTRDRVTPPWALVMGIKWYIGTMLIGIPVWGIEWVALRARRLMLQRLHGSRNVINGSKTA